MRISSLLLKAAEVAGTISRKETPDALSKLTESVSRLAVILKDKGTPKPNAPVINEIATKTIESKTASFSSWGRVSAKQEIQNVTSFDKSIADRSTDKDAKDGCFKLPEKLNEASKTSYTPPSTLRIFVDEAVRESLRNCPTFKKMIAPPRNGDVIRLEFCPKTGKLFRKD